MSDFFNGLGDVLAQQFSLGDSKLKSLDVVKNGHTVPYGKLGAFANQFDQSAERSYTEEGFQRTSLFNPRQKQLEIWMQEPEVTILVKKRAFASLADNTRIDLADDQERLFLRATKFLFQNKCKQIAAYERLTKLESVAIEMGSLDHHLMPALFAATDTLGSLFSGSSSFNKFKAVIDQVKTITNLSRDTLITNWTTNQLNSFRTDLGTGTGVIEFTTAFNISTTTSINFGGGSFNITFVDPYQLMRVTHNDIEQAIADATNTVKGSSFVQLSLDIVNKGIQDDKAALNKMRARRNANPINFIIEPDTFLGKRIRAIIDNSGIEIQFTGSIFNVNIDPAYFRGAELAGADGIDPNSYGRAASLLGVAALTLLNPAATIIDPSGVAESVSIQPNSEAALFNRIVKSAFNQLQINKNSQTVMKAHNAKTNDIRKKLRLHYGTKLIIQPMDVVHIFVSSKTKVDNKIIGGLQDAMGGGFLQTASKAFANMQDFFHAGQNDSVEKSLSVGRDFPNWLWLIMRNQFTKDKSGTQIFAGLVANSTSSYDSNGTFNVAITGTDNAAYFKFGVVNQRPATDVFDGSLYDPLTPFDIKFDRANGFEPDKVPDLLPENKALFKSVFLKYASGRYVGKKPTINNFVQDSERIQNASIRKVFYDPNGMVYKWKEGIGSLVMFGNTAQESATNTSLATTTTDPFAGQDIMNVLSLLITGEPYNFATFYKATIQVDNTGRDPHTGADPAVSFFRSFQTDLKYRNLLYGNFVPFKKLTMDNDTYKNVLNYQINATTFDAELKSLLQEKADLNDKITFASDNGQVVTSTLAILQAKATALNDKITIKQQQITTELTKANKPISIVGDDITMDYDLFFEGKDQNKLSDIYQRNKDLRKKTHYLTRRMSWKVRANQDVNLFIVDDSYDKDYDIQAFEKAFSNPSLFKSDYITVAEKIEHVAKLLELEVFADSQGHIQIRPPQYNKMPSSTFYRMLRLKDEFDIQVYPQFLEDLYADQLTNTTAKLEVIEDEIRMYGLALSRSTDAAIEDLLATNATFIQANPVANTYFKFLSDDQGIIPRIQLINASADSTKAKEAEEVFAQSLEALGSIKTQATINNIFSVSTRVELLRTATVAKQAFNFNTVDFTNREKRVSDRLFSRTGQIFNLRQLFPGSENQVQINIKDADLVRIMQEIATRLADRQRTLKIAASALKNIKESLSTLQGTKKSILPGFLNNDSVPQAFENLIEDENYDDYGPNSGRRYVIKNHHIKTLTIKEDTPPFTTVEVQGKFADNFAINPPADLNGFRGGGNALTTAVAVDYDLMRMYGFRSSQTIDAPFLTNPREQCAPFAVALLNKARKQVQTGSVTIVGNEYMQVGEVVYLENQDMLFYVESVNHSITYGRTFSTTLNLAYGHMPGEYIPTYLDTIGKILYKNREITNIAHKRQGNVNNEEHVGTIVGNLLGQSDMTAEQSIMNGIFADENRHSLTAILQAAGTAFSVGQEANYTPILELRIFFAPENGFESVNPTANDLAQVVKKFLLGKINLFELAKVEQPDKLLGDFEDQIEVQPVNANDKNEFRSPSISAYSMARAALTKLSVHDKASDKRMDKIMHQFVVDCWIYSENKDEGKN